MSRENNSLFAEYGISPVQLQALVFVHLQAEKGRAVCQKDIEKYMNLRASSVSTLISTLEKNGLVRRAVADGDARTKFISMTAEGAALCRKNKILMDNCDALIQSALSEREQETFRGLLLKVIAEIEKPVKEIKQ